jgi:DNA repair exonuclease SbcCD ATPase subunit
MMADNNPNTTTSKADLDQLLKEAQQQLDMVVQQVTDKTNAIKQAFDVSQSELQEYRKNQAALHQETQDGLKAVNDNVAKILTDNKNVRDTYKKTVETQTAWKDAVDIILDNAAAAKADIDARRGKLTEDEKAIKAAALENAKTTARLTSLQQKYTEAEQQLCKISAPLLPSLKTIEERRTAAVEGLRRDVNNALADINVSLKKGMNEIRNTVITSAGDINANIQITVKNAQQAINDNTDRGLENVYSAIEKQIEEIAAEQQRQLEYILYVGIAAVVLSILSGGALIALLVR